MYRTDGPLKPFILQDEQALQVQMLGRDSDYFFENKAIKLGVDARRAVGYGMWEYAAKVTLAGLGELFADARGIMAWLGAAASAVVGTGAVVSWHTPLGLPVSQPYRSLKPKTVQTVVQRVVLDGGAVRANAHRAPAQKRRQRAAYAGVGSSTVAERVRE